MRATALQTTPPRCSKCGLHREPCGMSRWKRCQVCHPPKPVDPERSHHKAFTDDPAEIARYTPPDIGRQYLAPPASGLWADQEFRSAVRSAVVRARCYELHMGVIIQGPHGLTAAPNPRNVRPKQGVAIVGMQPDRKFVVYLCSNLAEQFQVPEEWYGR